MKVSQKIEKQLQTIPDGVTFRYQDMAIEAEEYGAAAKSLERLVATGQLQKLKKGLFYKPQQTQFGAVLPPENELLKPYLFEKGQRIGYISGTGLYNKMGLTTQMSFIVTLVSRTGRGSVIEIGNLKIKPVKSYVDVTNENYILLEILDALKDFKEIPNLDRELGVTILKTKIRQLTTQQIQQLINNASKYPARASALLGAILEEMDSSLDLNALRQNFSPLTKYNMGITSNILPNAIKWNLK